MPSACQIWTLPASLPRGDMPNAIVSRAPLGSELPSRRFATRDLALVGQHDYPRALS